MGFGTIMIIYHYFGLGFLVAAAAGNRDRLHRALIGVAILAVVAAICYPIYMMGAIIPSPRALLGIWPLPAMAGIGAHFLMNKIPALQDEKTKRREARKAAKRATARNDKGESIEQAVARLDKALKTGDMDGVLACYDDDAVVMLESGNMVRGKAQLKSVFKRFLGSGLASTRHPQVVEAGDMALFVARWSSAGKSHDHEGGTAPPPTFTATSVFRRSPDETGALRWRLMIDNPFGPGTRSA